MSVTSAFVSPSLGTVIVTTHVTSLFARSSFVAFFVILGLSGPTVAEPDPPGPPSVVTVLPTSVGTVMPLVLTSVVYVIVY